MPLPVFSLAARMPVFQLQLVVFACFSIWRSTRRADRNEPSIKPW
jgi:hypothetical protein